jgi:hypothetical protein
MVDRVEQALETTEDRLERAKREWRERLLKKPACVTCKRRKGEWVTGLADGGYWSQEDGWHAPDGRRFTWDDVATITRYIEEIAEGECRQVKVKLNEWGRCERCQIVFEKDHPVEARHDQESARERASKSRKSGRSARHRDRGAR